MRRALPGTMFFRRRAKGAALARRKGKVAFGSRNPPHARHARLGLTPWSVRGCAWVRFRPCTLLPRVRHVAGLQKQVLQPLPIKGRLPVRFGAF